MKQLTCEMCGSTDLVKQDGVFVCQTCGTKYSVEEAKKMIVEGTVEIQGTVKVDETEKVHIFLKRANLALVDQDYKEAKEFAEQALNFDAECAQAYLIELLCDYKINIVEQLSEIEEKYFENPLYKKVIMFAGEDLREQLILIEKTWYYNEAVRYTNCIAFREAYQYVLDCFKRAQGIKNADELLAELVDKREERIKIEQERKKKLKTVQNVIAIMDKHIVGLKTDGTVNISGENLAHSQLDTSTWENIVAISAGKEHLVGLKSDGTVVATGLNRYGECEVSAWKNIIAILTSGYSTIGLKADGTIVAVGSHMGWCNKEEWKDIVEISKKADSIEGLKINGEKIKIKITRGELNLPQFELKEDGAIDYKNPPLFNRDYENWKYVVDFNSCGYALMMALRVDGKVFSSGSNDWKFYYKKKIDQWNDIIQIACIKDDRKVYAIGLKADGSLLLEGGNYSDVKSIQEWKDIIGIFVEDGVIVGIKSNGRVLTTGNDVNGRCNIKNWELFNNVNNIEEERYIAQRNRKEKRLCMERERLLQEQNEAKEKHRLEQEKKKKEEEKLKVYQWQQRNLCQYCGGGFKGLFTKTCSSCGKKKDY